MRAADEVHPLPWLARRMEFLDDRLMMLEGVHLGEIVVADDLGEARDKGLRIVAQIDVLLRQVDRLLDLRHRPHDTEIGHRRPVGRRLRVDAVPDRIEQFVLRAVRQFRDRRLVGLRPRLHAVRRRADLGAGVPSHQQQKLGLDAQPVEPQQPAAQIGAGVQMDVHRVAGQGAHEQPRRADRQGLAAAFERQPVSQGLRHQRRDLGIDVDLPDRLAERADRRRFVVARALPQNAGQQPVLFDEALNFRHWVRHRVERQYRAARHIAHDRPHQQRQIRLVEDSRFESAPHRARKHEVMVVVPVLLDRDRHQQIEHLDRRCGLPQREEDVVGQVPLAAPDSHQPGRFGRLEIPYIVRLVFEELVGAHRRVVDVLVRQRDMLQDRQITLLALEPLDELCDGIEAGQGVQRAAMMAGRHFGRARDRQRRGHQHRRDRHPGA